ncbi:MAG: alpha/beta hydrolase, partial [Pseudomonadota bacterium]|nr:alpha/beta hydrolase [Pseudomonadota bacterium]
MERIEIDGVGLEVQRLPGQPERAPIVFLHEGLGSVAMWRAWPAEVCAAAGRSGVVYSRRGYGNSDPVPDVRGTGRLAPDYMHREAWEVLPRLLAALGIAQPVLLGHSDGGSIALL